MLTRRAYRGAAVKTDVDQLLAIYREDEPNRISISASRRALESAAFVAQVRAAGRAGSFGSSSTSYRLSDLELASRLSFFLWKSIPDDELLRVAERGQLSDRQVLTSQVRRLLADDRSQRFLNGLCRPVARGAQSQHAATRPGVSSSTRR